MTRTNEGFSEVAMAANLAGLQENPYPGRGIVLGRTEDGEKAVQAYWVTGRSENSRNRILVEDGQTVKTEAHDASKVTDPSLIIYAAMRAMPKGRVHIVSNGNQTDTAYNVMDDDLDIALSYPARFARGMFAREFEPDAPNFTPRISGFTTILDSAKGNRPAEYGYSIIRRDPLVGSPVHTTGHGMLEDIPAGTGVCMHTYQSDGDPLPSFEGNPFPVAVPNSARAVAEGFWEALNRENRVAIVAKTIDLESLDVRLCIINALDETAVRQPSHTGTERGYN